MISDAGYPEGFTIALNCTAGETSSAIQSQDVAAMIQEQWGKIGVDVKIVLTESAAWNNIRYFSREYQAGVDTGFGTCNALQRLNQFTSLGEMFNWDQYYDAYYTQQIFLANETADIPTRDAILKAAAVYMLDTAPEVVIGTKLYLNYWWPWVKNYWGEACDSHLDYTHLVSDMWFDQDLKAEMGY